MASGGRRRSAGFTLVELMIVVTILGVLAALAVPAFTRYVRRARTAEAAGHLNKMWSGSVAYYATDFMTQSASGAVPLARQFPGPAATQVGGGTACGCQTGGRCPGGDSAFETPVWQALKFAVRDPYLYKPSFQSSGTDASAVFTATATGDLDCDSVLATFVRIGGVTPVSGDVTGSAAPQVTNEFE